MVTDVDHVENLRRQLLDKKRAKEAEIEEINQLIYALGAAPRVLKGEPARQHQEQALASTSTRYNLTFAKDVEDYVASYAFDEAIKISAMLETLKKEKGLQGKQKSLYAYASQVLRRLTDAGKYNLKHEEGVGYFRARSNDIDADAAGGR